MPLRRTLNHLLYLLYHRPPDVHRRSFLLLVFLLSSLALSLFLLQSSLELRRQAQKPEIQTFPLLLEIVSDGPDQYRIKRATQVASKITRKTNPKTPTYLQAQNQLEPLEFLNTLQGESFLELGINEASASNTIYYPLDTPTAYTTIEFSGEPLTLINTRTGKQHRLEINPFRPAPSNIHGLSVYPTSPKTLDLVFLANNFPDANTFTTTVNAMSQYLKNLYPFNQYPNRLNIIPYFQTTNLSCTRPPEMPRLITCNLWLVNQVLADQPYDSLIVVDYTREYGGGAYVGSNIAFTYSDTNTLAKEVTAHEFGHSFGGLADEYVYSDTDQYSGLPPWPNCATVGCHKWLGTPDTGCFPGCTYVNLYRPTQNTSLMRTLFPDFGPRYGPVSETHLHALLLDFTTLPSDYDRNGFIDFLDLLGLTSLFDYTQVITHYGQ